MLWVLGDLRLKMMPIFTTRSVRATENSWKPHARKAVEEPQRHYKIQAQSSILEAAFPNDKRMRRPEPDDIKRLNPDDASKWVGNSFSDRIEINVVGDFLRKSCFDCFADNVWYFTPSQ